MWRTCGLYVNIGSFFIRDVVFVDLGIRGVLELIFWILRDDWIFRVNFGCLSFFLKIFVSFVLLM